MRIEAHLAVVELESPELLKEQIVALETLNEKPERILGVDFLLSMKLSGWKLHKIADLVGLTAEALLVGIFEVVGGQETIRMHATEHENIFFVVEVGLVGEVQCMLLEAHSGQYVLVDVGLGVDGAELLRDFLF